MPLRIFFFGKDDNPQYFDGALSPALILFLPWAFKGKWLEEKKLLAGFALLYALYALFLADLRARYLLPIVPPLAALLAYGVHNVYLRIVRPSLLIGALLFFAALHGSYLWGYFQGISPLGYLTGRETRDAYLARMMPEYPVYQYVNRELPAQAKIYLLFVGRRAYYCERDYFHDGGEPPWFLMQVIRSARGGEEVEAGLESRGLTHLLVREDLLERFLGRNLTSNERLVWDAFVARHLRLLFQAQGYSVYQLHG